MSLPRLIRIPLFIIIAISISNCISKVTVTKFNNPSAVQTALDNLSNSTGIDQQRIVVLSAENMYWSNTCLDFPEPNENCQQSNIPGWLIILAAAGKQYEYHTDITSSQIRHREISLTTSPQFAVLASMIDLSSSLGVPIDEISIISYMQVNWPDMCLGLPDPGEDCLKNITPGWLVFLKSSGEVFEYHTNNDGKVIRSTQWSGRAG
jgi:hypothetical protein